jgi:hypothetical protein
MINENSAAVSMYNALRNRYVEGKTRTFRETLLTFRDLFGENSEGEYTCVIVQDLPAKNEELRRVEVARCIGWQPNWECSPSVLNVCLYYHLTDDWRLIEPATFGFESTPISIQDLLQTIFDSDLFFRCADCVPDNIATEFHGSNEFSKICEWFPSAVLNTELLTGCTRELREKILGTFRQKSGRTKRSTEVADQAFPDG